MKKLTLFLLLLGLGFIHQVFAQERQIIQGYCKDENGKAIENVSVYAHDSLLVSVTDEQGRFTYSYAKAGEKLRFAHMVFERADLLHHKRQRHQRQELDGQDENQKS